MATTQRTVLNLSEITKAIQRSDVVMTGDLAPASAPASSGTSGYPGFTPDGQVDPSQQGEGSGGQAPTQTINFQQSELEYAFNYYGTVVPFLMNKLPPEVTTKTNLQEFWNAGIQDAKAEAVRLEQRQAGNIQGMKSLATNAQEAAVKSCQGLYTACVYTVLHRTLGGVGDAVKETSYMYHVAKITFDRIKELEASSGGEGASATPEEAATIYFNQEERLHRGNAEAKKTAFTWIQGLIASSDRDRKGSATEYDRRYWQKVYDLAIAILPKVSEEADEYKSQHDDEGTISMWWLLLPAGVIGGAIFYIKFFG